MESISELDIWRVFGRDDITPKEKQVGARSLKLIVGNGLIGRHLYYRLRDNAVMTTRKELDLSNDSWQLPKCSIAYICAAETSTQVCEDRPEETRLVNVLNTVQLAERLKPAKVVWISSERVFDGSIPFRKVTAQTCPTTEYGRQKAEAEKLLLDLGVTIVRFSKVLGWDVPLFSGWISSLDNGLPIHPYSNMGMSPVSVNFVVDVLQKIDHLGGLLQISADRDISYAGVANYLVNYMGKESGLVQPVETDKPHPYMTLENNIPGIDVPDAWDIIHDWCQNRLLNRTQ